MPWDGAGGQNVEHLHTLDSDFEVDFFVKCILVLLARRDAGELRCHATALIYWHCHHYLAPSSLNFHIIPEKAGKFSFLSTAVKQV